MIEAWLIRPYDHIKVIMETQSKHQAESPGISSSVPETSSNWIKEGSSAQKVP